MESKERRSIREEEVVTQQVLQIDCGSFSKKDLLSVYGV